MDSFLKEREKLMFDPRDMPCLSHAPDFDHYCALKGQGCTYYVEEEES